MRYELDYSPEVWADRLRTYLPLAKKAYGSQPPGSPARVASDEVNKLLLEYVNGGGVVSALANELTGEISIAGLRRRVRVARAMEQAALEGDDEEATMGRKTRKRGITEPKLVKQAAKEIQEARELGGRFYGDAVRKWYDEGLSLNAIAEQIGDITSYSLWSAKRTCW